MACWKRSYLDIVSTDFNFTPRHGLVGPGSRVTAVKLLASIYVHSRLCTVAHQARVGDVVFYNTASEDNHARTLGADRDGVDFSDILDNVDFELLRRRLEGVKVQHIAQAAVGERRTENGNVVLVGPVIDGALVIDFLAETVDNFGRRPVDLVLGSLAGFLLLEHFVENRDNPVFESAVVGVGDDQVADAVQALFAQIGADGTK